MNLINKIKSWFCTVPQKRTGQIVVHLLNTETSQTTQRHICGISIFVDREEMTKYLTATVMTTTARKMKLLGYDVVND
jgi:hypothetical protein